MKDYRQFLFESYEKNKKIQWIKNAPVSSSVESKVLKGLIKDSTDNFYETYFTADNKVPNLTNEKPILLYYADKEREIGDKYLSENDITQKDVYNRTEEMVKSMQKKDWHELLGDKDWLPKTLTSTKGIDTLEFPIIAKPSEGHSGIGIMKFDNIEDCQKELDKKDCKLDVFSEMIKDIDTEYRFIFVKDKLFLVHERIPIVSENKTIITKDPEESLQFLYVEQDLENEEYDVSKIVEEFRKDIDLDFYALDIMLDKNGKYWIIESNSAIGMGGNTLARTYEAICEDFYGEISKDQKQLVERICSDYYKEIKKMYPKEIKKSKNPKIYS
jgi:hypothetical protein|tara:strand:- start:3890 stop:4876 length:987 start_codon:yes stop_codon:yes gene_type:complete